MPATTSTPSWLAKEKRTYSMPNMSSHLKHEEKEGSKRSEGRFRGQKSKRPRVVSEQLAQPVSHLTCSLSPHADMFSLAPAYTDTKGKTFTTRSKTTQSHLTTFNTLLSLHAASCFTFLRFDIQRMVRARNTSFRRTKKGNKRSRLQFRPLNATLGTFSVIRYLLPFALTGSISVGSRDGSRAGSAVRRGGFGRR